METKVNEAAERKMCGYNCAQAVACTYCNLAGLDEETTKELTQGFAVGMGGYMWSDNRSYKYTWRDQQKSTEDNAKFKEDNKRIQRAEWYGDL